jgi:voltage-gated potassium channel Kch
VPLWRLLHAAQVAARAGWDGVAAQALAVLEEAGRPRLAARVVAELALAAMDMLGRVETMLTLGYSDVLPPRRLAALEPLRG